MKEEKFNFEAFKQDALKKLCNKEPGATPEKLFRPLFKQFIEEALQAEMDSHLDDGERTGGNHRNGKSTTWGRKYPIAIQGYSLEYRESNQYL